MADETLLLLAKDVRNKTLKLLEGVDDQQARFAAPHLTNTVLWHAGHAIMVNEHLGVSPATGTPPAYPAGWFEKFGWKSSPAAVTDWPGVQQVREQLQMQLQRLTAAIESLSPQQLSRVVEGGRTLRHSILHGLHDEAGHQGEMYLLKKMYAKREGSG